MQSALRVVPFFLFFLFVVSFTTSCQTTAQRWTSTTTISDKELDEVEIKFSRFPPPPPQRSIEGVQEIVAEVNFSHNSACAGDDFYEVVLPLKGLQASYEQFNVPFAWRDAANTAFRYGDFDRALGYIDDAIASIPPGLYWIQYRGGMTYSKSIYLAVLGDVSGSSTYFSQASAGVGSYAGGFYEYRRNQAWAREAAAINAYAQGRFREAELRLRDIRSAWDGGLWYSSGSLASGDEWVAPNLKTHALSGDVLVNYLLVLSLANQNRLVEAEAEARLNLWRVGDIIDLAWIMDALAVVMLRQGRYADAEWVSQKMADFFEEKCAPSRYFVVLRTYLRLAHALAAQGKWEQALHYYGRAYSEHDKDASGVLDRLLLESPDWPIAQMLSGDVAGAHETFAKILSRVTIEYGADSYQAKEVVAFDALNSAISSRSQQGFLEDAVTALLETPGATLGNVADLDARERRMSLLVDEYLSLLDVSDIMGSAERSFLIAQAGRHSSVQSALASSALRARVSDPKLRSLLRKYQDILNRREEIDRLYAAQATLGTETYEGPGIIQLSGEVQTLEAAKITALARLKTEFPDFARLTDDTPLTAEQVTALLTPGEAVIQLRVTSDYTYVWAINHAGELSMARTSLPSIELDRLVERLRYSVDPGAITTLSDIPEFDVEAAFSLYETILKPVHDVWGDARSLIVVPDGALQQVPFSLLVTRAPTVRKKRTLHFEEYRTIAWLARSHAVMTLPSLASVAALRGFTAISRTDAREFVGFGDPVFSAQQRSSAETPGSTPDTLRSATSASDDRITLRALPEMRAVRSASLRDLPPLPDTREELLSIARSLGVDSEESVFLGVDANEQRLFGMDLSDVRILAFATHGLVKGDLDGLNEPALALSSPEVVGDEQGDGLLSLSEIIGLKLNADLVILSACNTASADGLGAEAVSGLGRAFFFAGTKSLLVSHWPVHSGATTSLMAKVFANLAVDSSVGRAEAVRRARVELIDDGTFIVGGTAAFSYAHPIFWAAFTVVGDGHGN